MAHEAARTFSDVFEKTIAQAKETQEQSSQAQGQERSQAQIDSSFIEMIAQSSPTQGYDMITQVVTSYFDTLEAQHRQARRIADLWAQSLILQQTQAQIVRAVVPLVFGCCAWFVLAGLADCCDGGCCEGAV